MNHIHYQNNELWVEQTPITKVAAQFGTPCYVYSRAAIAQQWHAIDQAFASHVHRIFYAVKANSNLAILNLLARLGSGFDIVSGGELARVLAAGGKAKNIVFSGVGKTTSEIQQALAANIFCFNVESQAELLRINTVAAEMQKTAQFALRINPDIDVATHPYIATGLKENKFGIPIDDALDLYRYAKTLPHLKPIGIATHIGSQITELAPFVMATEKLLELITTLKKEGIILQHLDLGGGIGASYQNENPPSFKDYADAILAKVKEPSLELLLEPGRSLIAAAGMLITKIEYLKHHTSKNFIVVDAAMNDLMRPALYQAWHGIIPVTPRQEGIMQSYDIVGPVCETADFIGKNRHLCVQENDLLAICTTGAYGFTMSSNYNTRPRAAEILVDKDHIYLIRKREEIADLFSHEQLIP